MDIGSQIIDLVPLEAAFRLLAKFVQTLRADGHTISHVDFGGGLGIPYHADREAPPAPAAYAAMVKRVTHNLGCTLMFEPGRMIVGNAGILVTRVIYVKHGDARNFVIIDAAMNDLIRPTLYEAHHDILPIRLAAGRAPTNVADPVGTGGERRAFLALGRTIAAPKSRYRQTASATSIDNPKALASSRQSRTSFTISPVAKPKSKVRGRIARGNLSRLAVFMPDPALITSIITAGSRPDLTPITTASEVAATAVPDNRLLASFIVSPYPGCCPVKNTLPITPSAG